MRRQVPEGSLRREAKIVKDLGVLREKLKDTKNIASLKKFLESLLDMLEEEGR